MDGSARKPYPGIGQALLLLLLQYGLVIGLFTLILVISVVTGTEIERDAPFLPFLDVLGYAIILFVGLRQTRRPVRQIFSFRPVRAAWLLPVVPLTIGTGILVSEVDNLTRRVFPVPPIITELFGDLLGPDLLSFLSVAVVAPVAEELLFRGLILQGFLARYRLGFAIAASAVIFALFHLNPYQYFTAFVAGIILGWLFLRTRSLWTCIAAHAFYNGQLWVLANLLSLGIPGYDAPSPGAVEFQPLWFDAVGIILLGAAIVWLRRLLPRSSAASGSVP